MDLTMETMILEIESQIIETYNEAILMYRLLVIAKEAGYDTVHDNWGHKAYDTYTIDEAIDKFKPKIQ
jgi:hypothetical protein